MLDTAYAFHTPAALVAGCSAARLDPVRKASFLQKTQVSRGALGRLLHDLEAGLPERAKLLTRPAR